MTDAAATQSASARRVREDDAPRQNNELGRYDGNTDVGAASHMTLDDDPLDQTPTKSTARDVHSIAVLDAAVARAHISHKSHDPSLHIDTHASRQAPVDIVRVQKTPTIFETPVQEDSNLQTVWTTSSSLPLSGAPLKQSLSTSSMASTASIGSVSALSSPYLAAMVDLTPLPSPTFIGDSSKRQSWRTSLGRPLTPRSRDGSMDDHEPTVKQLSPLASAKKRKGYGSLLQDAVGTSMVNAATVDENGTVVGGEHHTRNRSISDFVPEHLQNLRQRHVTFGPGDAANMEAQDHRMQREEYLANKRGLTTVPHPLAQPPTPATSTSSLSTSDDADNEDQFMEDGTAAEYLEIHCGMHNKRRKFRQLRQLGQGTFSKVMLATRQKIPARPTQEMEDNLDPHQLVAVKIVEQGPAGGADEQRIEIGLKREVEMLKSLSHPSIIHLKACEYQEHRALLVLTYCPGGDLFELASQKRELLTPHLIQRIFAELVGAVRYLHSNWIVHRDIKLENVLVNLSASALRSLSNDPRTHPNPIVTLTDLGLSRRIPEPPESPLLTTRCGSEDYAAPEILLGERYDGRATDAWALGVLLYALMEGRLPFDPPPGKPERSRNTHRIARCSWIWCRFGDDDGEWDSARSGAAAFEGARSCVEGLLKKVRMGRRSLQDVEAMEWVVKGIQVEGGLPMRADDEDDGLL